ncbi:hypothetical protein Ciccas_006274, partial [Cichlidogyrus casuarinus]
MSRLRWNPPNINIRYGGYSPNEILKLGDNRFTYGHSDRARVIAAVAYFASAFVIVVLCALTYFTLARLEFVRYFRDLGELEIKSTNDDSNLKKMEPSSSDQANLKGPSPWGESETPLLSTLILRNSYLLKDANSAEVPSYLAPQETSAISANEEVVFSDDGESSIYTLRRCFGLFCFKSPQGKKECRAYWSRYWLTFKDCWLFCLSVYLVFFCTLAVFPSIQARVRPNDPDYFIPAEWFSQVTCFFFFNLFAMLGCIATNFVQVPGPRWIWLPVLIRTFIFIPFFLLSNFGTDNSNTVLISNDHAYVFGAILFGFSNGYLSSLCMQYAPMS